MTRITLSFSFVLLFFFGAFAQDKTFESPNQTLINLNPSFAGSNGLFRSQSFYGKSNANFKKPPFIYYTAMDMYLNALKGGISLAATYQSIGPITSRGLSLGYSQNIWCMDRKLKVIPSLQLIYNEKFISSDWIIPATGTSSNGKTRYSEALNLNSGILLNYKGFYIGGSLFHEGYQNKFTLNRLIRYSTFHTSYNLKINAKNRLHFSLVSNSNISTSKLNFTTTALLCSHFIVAGGLERNRGLNYTGTLGYRNNYFTIQVGYTQRSIFSGGNVFTSASFNLRSKEKQREIGDLETW